MLKYIITLLNNKAVLILYGLFLEKKTANEKINFYFTANDRPGDDQVCWIDYRVSRRDGEGDCV